MPRWEYQVIHLNVEEKPNNQPPPPPPPVQTEGQPPNLQKVFSQTYLEQEFPNFYNAQQQQAKAAQPQHPALQLQHFLNGQGEQGWSLVGIYSLGSLLMMFFRRRVAEATAAEPAPAAPVAAPAPSPEAAPSPAAPAADTAVLEAILQRLQALEARLEQGTGSPSAAPAAPTPPPEPAASSRPARSASPRSQANRAAAPTRPVRPRTTATSDGRRTRRRSSATGGNGNEILQVIPKATDRIDGRILTPPERRTFEGEVGIPTVHAAKALGFRSYASLATFGTKHGYPEGLVKKGANQMVAIYQGSEKGAGGGKDKRLWVVVPQSRLPNGDS